MENLLSKKNVRNIVEDILGGRKVIFSMVGGQKKMFPTHNCSVKNISNVGKNKE
jgi:hypothetical protein